MRSLRSKFTLTLLISSLLSLVVAGLVARSILYREFNHFVMEDSFKRFRAEMTVYFETYGSWEKAVKIESFGDFERRRRPMLAGPEGQRRPGMPRSFAGAGRPEGAAETMHGWQSDGSQRPGGPQPPAEPAAIADEKKRPPFQFMLTDPAGKVLIGEANAVGKSAPPALATLGKPIMIGGRTVAIAIPDPRPNLTHLDVAYLNAMRQALMYALVAAALFALVLGFVVGTRLNRELSQLTSAIQSMGDGDLRQQVVVNSRDEIGALAHAFNRMSADLARAHDELSASHEKIAKQAELLQEAAIRDKLTGLYNRRHFDEQAAVIFARAARYNRPLSVMIADIDFFKRINDTFSHATGDEVLRRVGDMLRATTRESDLVARYGGEEFVIAFPETELAPASVRCEALRQAVESHPWQDIHPDLCVTISIGLDGDLGRGGFDKMLAAADTRLYRAKQSGRNRACWEDSEMDSIEIVAV